jgi:hypothetical protein
MLAHGVMLVVSLLTCVAKVTTLTGTVVAYATTAIKPIWLQHIQPGMFQKV